MNIQAINNSPNFGARIKINKTAANDLLTTGIGSGIGTTATVAGVSSSMPMSDPAHHIYSAAKVVDGMQASTGAGLFAGGASAFRFATSFLKSGIKNLSKTNSTKIPS